jgi:hypothetical protein
VAESLIKRALPIGQPDIDKAIININESLYNLQRKVFENVEDIAANKASIAGISGGSGSTEPNPFYAAGDFYYPATNPAPLDTDTGTNGLIKVHRYDDTTEQSVQQQFRVPSDIDTTGDVTFHIIGYAYTAATANVGFTFYHSAAGDSESWDTAFNDEDSGALACDTTPNDLDHFSYSVSVTTLGWSANDFCRFRLARDVGVASNLSGNYGVAYFMIDIPRA